MMRIIMMMMNLQEIVQCVLNCGLWKVCRKEAVSVFAGHYKFCMHFQHSGANRFCVRQSLHHTSPEWRRLARSRIVSLTFCFSFFFQTTSSPSFSVSPTRPTFSPKLSVHTPDLLFPVMWAEPLLAPSTFRTTMT